MEQTAQVLERCGHFTSSRIGDLMTNGRAKDTYGAPFYTYVEEKAMESVIGRALDVQADAPPLAWGNLCESIAFDELEFDYKLVSKDRFFHPVFEWSGMPDLLNEDTVGDIKCPWTLKSFLTLAMCRDIETLKKEARNYYWQLVSNSILCDKPNAELILFMPSEKDIDYILERATQADSIIKYKTKEQLPYLPTGAKVGSIQRFKFEVPQEDKDALIQRVELGIEKIKERINELSWIINH